MVRPVDPSAPNRVRVHVVNGYPYAITQPYHLNDRGMKVWRQVYWGTVDGLKFHPGKRYWEASPDERDKLIFPDNWDTSETRRINQLGTTGLPAIEVVAQNRLYGDIWLLEQVAIKTGVISELMTVFEGNRDTVNDILTLSIFPFITGHKYNRLARWQNITKTPSTRTLQPYSITRLTQSITEQNRMDLLTLRAAKLGPNELCALDSTTRPGYGTCLTDLRNGHSKDHLPLRQSTEAIVYSLSTHMPVYYRSWPGNIPDSRTLDTILDDLIHAGFKDNVLITDRGYETEDNLDHLIKRDQSVILCTKTGQADVFKIIEGLGVISDYPSEMEYDIDYNIYYGQYNITHEIEQEESQNKLSKDILINLYFDPFRRAHEISEIKTSLKEQKISLDGLIEKKVKIKKEETLDKNHSYYNIIIDPTTKLIQSYSIKDNRISKLTKKAGFIAIITYKIDFDAMKVFKIYRLRDEQEKCFQQMKSQMVSDRQLNSTEDGKIGRLFILFISLSLSSYLRYTWKNSNLFKLFYSSLDILDEMRSIRYIEYTNGDKAITPFVGKQVDICKAFDVEIPKGCSPTYPSPQTTKRRGRPAKKSKRSIKKNENAKINETLDNLI